MKSARLVLAWLVHFYTALGAVIAFAALLCIEERLFAETFWLLALAVIIDATDGALARSAQVKDVIPWFDGARLDDIVDYLTYVFIPVFFMYRAGLFPAQDRWWIATIPLLASAYGFCQAQAKTADHFFCGFPSYWNILAFYLYVLKTPLWINAFATLALSVMVFVPIRYVYPSRSQYLRMPTIVLGALWGVMLALIVYQLPEPSTKLTIASLAFPAYYTALSFWLEFRRSD